MDSDKQEDTPINDEPPKESSEGTSSAPSAPSSSDNPPEQDAPTDALSLTPDELEEEKAAKAAADTDLSGLDEPEEKKVSPLKRFFKKVNIYFLIFLVLVVVAGAISIVNYINSQKTPIDPAIGSQALSEEALKQLANTDTSVGTSSQTLTIQGNAIIAGQTLARGNLSVAGDLQTGGSIQGPSLTVSGTTNLADTQINNLQVATNVAIQGSTTIRDLNVAGTSSFSGAMTAAQITVTRLILSGNASLEIPNHIRFTGPTPTRSVNNGILGNGGSSSLSGSDTAGYITVNSGNNPIPGCYMRITFRQPFSNQPRVVVAPVGQAAGQSQFYIERDNSGFSLCSANALSANKTFGFDYFVTN